MIRSASSVRAAFWGSADTVSVSGSARMSLREMPYFSASSEAFVEKLERLYPSIEYVNPLMVHSWGQKVVRFYDLDGNLIEVGTPT